MTKRRSFLADVDPKSIDFEKIKKSIGDKISGINQYTSKKYIKDNDSFVKEDTLKKIKDSILPKHPRSNKESGGSYYGQQKSTEAGKPAEDILSKLPLVRERHNNIFRTKNEEIGEQQAEDNNKTISELTKTLDHLEQLKKHQDAINDTIHPINQGLSKEQDVDASLKDNFSNAQKISDEFIQGLLNDIEKLKNEFQQYKSINNFNQSNSPAENRNYENLLEEIKDLDEKRKLLDNKYDSINEIYNKISHKDGERVDLILKEILSLREDMIKYANKADQSQGLGEKESLMLTAKSESIIAEQSEKLDKILKEVESLQKQREQVKNMELLPIYSDLFTNKSNDNKDKGAIEGIKERLNELKSEYKKHGSKESLNQGDNVNVINDILQGVYDLKLALAEEKKNKPNNQPLSFDQYYKEQEYKDALKNTIDKRLLDIYDAIKVAKEHSSAKQANKDNSIENKLNEQIASLKELQLKEAKEVSNYNRIIDSLKDIKEQQVQKHIQNDAQKEIIVQSPASSNVPSPTVIVEQKGIEESKIDKLNEQIASLKELQLKEAKELSNYNRIIDSLKDIKEQQVQKHIQNDAQKEIIVQSPASSNVPSPTVIVEQKGIEESKIDKLNEQIASLKELQLKEAKEVNNYNRIIDSLKDIKEQQVQKHIQNDAQKEIIVQSPASSNVPSPTVIVEQKGIEESKIDKLNEQIASLKELQLKEAKEVSNYNRIIDSLKDIKEQQVQKHIQNDAQKEIIVQSPASSNVPSPTVIVEQKGIEESKIDKLNEQIASLKELQFKESKELANYNRLIEELKDIKREISKKDETKSDSKQDNFDVALLRLELKDLQESANSSKYGNLLQEIQNVLQQLQNKQNVLEQQLKANKNNEEESNKDILDKLYQEIKSLKETIQESKTSENQYQEIYDEIKSIKNTSKPQERDFLKDSFIERRKQDRYNYKDYSIRDSINKLKDDYSKEIRDMNNYNAIMLELKNLKDRDSENNHQSSENMVLQQFSNRLDSLNHSHMMLQEKLNNYNLKDDIASSRESKSDLTNPLLLKLLDIMVDQRQNHNVSVRNQDDNILKDLVQYKLIGSLLQEESTKASASDAVLLKISNQIKDLTSGLSVNYSNPTNIHYDKAVAEITSNIKNLEGSIKKQEELNAVESLKKQFNDYILKNKEKQDNLFSGINSIINTQKKQEDSLHLIESKIDVKNNNLLMFSKEVNNELNGLKAKQNDILQTMTAFNGDIKSNTVIIDSFKELIENIVDKNQALSNILQNKAVQDNDCYQVCIKLLEEIRGFSISIQNKQTECEQLHRTNQVQLIKETQDNIIKIVNKLELAINQDRDTKRDIVIDSLQTLEVNFDELKTSIEQLIKNKNSNIDSISYKEDILKVHHVLDKVISNQDMLVDNLDNIKENFAKDQNTAVSFYNDNIEVLFDIRTKQETFLKLINYMTQSNREDNTKLMEDISYLLKDINHRNDILNTILANVNNPSALESNNKLLLSNIDKLNSSISNIESTNKELLLKIDTLSGSDDGTINILDKLSGMIGIQEEIATLLRDVNEEIARNIVKDSNNSEIIEKFLALSKFQIEGINKIKDDLSAVNVFFNDIKQSIENRELEKEEGEEIKEKISQKIDNLQNIQQDFLDKYYITTNNIIEQMPMIDKNFSQSKMEKLNEVQDNIKNLAKKSEDISASNQEKPKESKKLDIGANLQYLQKEINKKID